MGDEDLRQMLKNKLAEKKKWSDVKKQEQIQNILGKRGEDFLRHAIPEALDVDFFSFQRSRSAYQQASAFKKVQARSVPTVLGMLGIGLAGYNISQNKKKEKQRALQLKEAKKKLEEV